MTVDQPATVSLLTAFSNSLFLRQHPVSLYFFFSSSMYAIALFSSWLLKLQWPDALSLPTWRGSNPFPSELLFLVHRTVNVDIKMEAGLSVSLAFFLSCDCLRATQSKPRQAEMASTLSTCHLRCVSYGHVALKACPSRRELHNENP